MLKDRDPKVWNLINQEHKRQLSTLTMIPSENFTSSDVNEAAGSVLTNKYSEGYPKKRYYQGNLIVDSIELLAIDRAKKLFGAEHANVQPLSGSPANQAAYMAVLQPGDTIMTLDLMHGGHLTHGSKVNFSGKMYNVVHFEVDKHTGLLNMENIRKLAAKHKPKMIISGFTAYPRIVDFFEFHNIAQMVGAISLADISHIAGLIAGGVHPSPFPFTDIVTTTTHKTLRGPRGAMILCKEKFAKAVDKAVFPGMQGGPHENVIAAKAVAFKKAMTPEFRDYAFQIVHNAKALAKVLMDHKVKLVSDGTDTHLLLIDLIGTPFIAKEGLGRKYAVALEEAGIITNCNTIPFDPSTPFKPSGIRLGTPALTSMGFKENDMVKVGHWIVAVLRNPDNKEVLKMIRQDIESFLKGRSFYQRN